MNKEEKVSLYCTTGGSSKEYHLELVEATGGWLVNFRYGAIGSTLRPGTKTKAPVPYDKAKKAYDKVVHEKLTDSPPYTTGEHGNAYQEPVTEIKHSGMLPQLLNDIDEADIESKLRDPDWYAQEKHDGENRMSRKDATGNVVGTNKKGRIVSMSVSHAQGVAKIGRGEVEVSGEDLGSHYVIFDILKNEGKDLRGLSYAARLDHLEEQFKPSEGLELIETARTEAEKRALLKTLIARNAEGIVFKRASAPFTEGRPNSGGDQLRFKFWAEATVEVSALSSTKRSVAVRVHGKDGEVRDLGNVTIPQNQPIPNVGSIVEVRYLYCHVGGDLAIATYKGPRSDADLSDCRLSQLKYKAVSIYKLQAAAQAANQGAYSDQDTSGCKPTQLKMEPTVALAA